MITADNPCFTNTKGIPRHLTDWATASIPCRCKAPMDFSECFCWQGIQYEELFVYCGPRIHPSLMRDGSSHPALNSAGRRIGGRNSRAILFSGERYRRILNASVEQKGPAPSTIQLGCASRLRFQSHLGCLDDQVPFGLVQLDQL